MSGFNVAASGVLTFEAVSKWYGQVSALSDIAFEMGPGVTGLVGQNGAGKSTLMKLASGLLRPSLGTVLLCGAPPRDPRARRQMGFCPDTEQLYERLTGLAFTTWMLRLTGVAARAARDRAAALLDQIGLGANMHRPIREYSKGMRQRVRLAQALAHEPRVVLLDEPMTGLDPVARRETVDLIRDLADRGVALLVSSHVLHELEAMVDRVLLIHQGRVMAEGAVRELREQMDGQPHRLRLRSSRPRALASRLAGLEHVSGIEIDGLGVEVATSGQAGLYEELTRIGAEEGLVEEILPVDDSLASVFGYLVG